MARPFHKFLIFLVVTAIVVSCTPDVDVEPPRTQTAVGSLQSYISPTPSVTPFPATPIPTQTPLPTATPHLYIVKSGDTMGSVALEFGLDMGDLVNANPDVSPSAMSIGQELVIPVGEGVISDSIVEPLRIPFADPDCYTTPSGGMWCFVLAQNNTDGVIEGISFNVQVYDGTGTLVASETAFPLLDRLPSGETTPALIHLANVPAGSQVYARLLTAFEGAEDDENYPITSLQGVLTQVAWDGKSAEVIGEVIVENGNAEKVWVLATAYSVDGAVVGVRKWEAEMGEQMFNLTVASLGPEIERVLLSVEAH